MEPNIKLISPNLGCPFVLDLLGSQPWTIPVIVSSNQVKWATPHCEFKFQLLPSYPDGKAKVLELKLDHSRCYPIENPDAPRKFNNVEQNRDVIALAVQKALVPPGHLIFHGELELGEADGKEWMEVAKSRSQGQQGQLYDLQICYEGNPVICHPHSVYLSPIGDREVHLIQINDLHLAYRNELLEIHLKETASTEAGEFNNFNKNFQKTIAAINSMAREGKADGVLILGDIVDFVGTKLAEEVPTPDNNWNLFTHIVVGCKDMKGCPVQGDEGLCVPVFTTAGNHDWRKNPYDATFSLTRSGFGLSQKVKIAFNPFYLNSDEEVEKKIEEVFDKIEVTPNKIYGESFWRAWLRWIGGKLLGEKAWIWWVPVLFVFIHVFHCLYRPLPFVENFSRDLLWLAYQIGIYNPPEGMSYKKLTERENQLEDAQSLNDVYWPPLWWQVYNASSLYFRCETICQGTQTFYIVVRDLKDAQGNNTSPENWKFQICTTSACYASMTLDKLLATNAQEFSPYKDYLTSKWGIWKIGSRARYPADLGHYLQNLLLAIVAALLFAWILPWLQLIPRWFFREGIRQGLIPIESDVRALYPYFQNVNPYFNLAVRFGNSATVILMETGADIFYGQELFAQGTPYQKRKMSIEDNILGGSPDTTGFWESNLYATFPQLCWLERVLSLSPKGVVVGTHTPVLNHDKPLHNLKHEQEFSLKQLQYGAVSQYAEQFIAKCRDKVLAVLSAHTHENTEFRVVWNNEQPHYFAHQYSTQPQPLPAQGLWFVITAACGPKNDAAPDVPYLRHWQVTATQVRSFKAEHV